MLKIKREDYYFDVFPRVVVSARETVITIRPLDLHTAFDETKTYTVRVIPMTSDVYTKTKPAVFSASCKLLNGALTFSHAFCGEQEHSVRIFCEGSDVPVLKTVVYSVPEDLYELTPLLGDFHVHTCFSDGVESPEFVAAMYRQAGYDFIPITDHGRMDSSLRAIKRFAHIPMDFKLYPGEEVHPPMDHVHIVHFGGNTSVNEQCLTGITKNPWEDPGKPEWVAAREAEAKAFTDLPEGVDPYVHACCLHVIDEIHKAGGMAIFCHPFWLADVHNVTDSFTRLYLENGYADAFELIGGQTNHENMLQVALYQELRAQGAQIPVVGNSDSHGTVDRVYFDQMKTIVFARANEKDAIIDAVKAQKSVAMEEYDGQEPRYYGSFRLVRYAQFLYETYFPLKAELCFEEGRLMRRIAAGDKKAEESLARLYGQTTAFARHFFGKE